MIEDFAVMGVAIFVFVVGLALAHWSGKRVIGRRARQMERFEDRGAVYSSDIMLRISLLGVWAGGAFAGLSLLPALAWMAGNDSEARDIALRMFLVAVVIFLGGLLGALLGTSFFVLEPDRVMRVSALRERSIGIDAIERVDEAGVFPAIRVRGEGAKIRIPKTVGGFDDLFNQLVARLDHGVLTMSESAAGESGAAELGPIEQVASYAVSRRRVGINLAVLGGLLVFFLAWPWFLVEGEHPVRDSFFFMGIGVFLWLLIALLVRNETFQPGQPMALELRPGVIAWKPFRGAWHERPMDDLVSASVETTIIYIKGQPGHRYPLRLRFTDREVVEIDDFRARHLGASTHLLGHDIRRRYLTTADRTDNHRVAADERLQDARHAESSGDLVAAVAAYRRAIALWPSRANLALLSHVGNLLKDHSETVDAAGVKGRKAQAAVRAEAIGHYRAHVDFFPEDANTWQALGAVLSGGHRSDLADEAIATAEQLLMSGRHSVADG